MLIRDADAERDAGACAALYAPFVRDTPISLEERVPTAEELADRIETTTRTHPWLVAHDGEALLGYAYATRHRERACYRWAADVTVYVAPRKPAPRGRPGALPDPVRSSWPSRDCASRAPASPCPTPRVSGCTSRSGSSPWACTGTSAGSSAPGTTSAGGSSRSAVAAGRPESSVRRSTYELRSGLVEEQRQRRAGVDRAPGQPEQVGRHLGLVEDRIAPVVEADQLGQQLRAQAVGLARDRVDAQPARSSDEPPGERTPEHPGATARRRHRRSAQRQPGRPGLAAPAPVRLDLRVEHAPARSRRTAPRRRGDGRRRGRGPRTSSAAPASRSRGCATPLGERADRVGDRRAARTRTGPHWPADCVGQVVDHPGALVQAAGALARARSARPSRASSRPSAGPRARAAARSRARPRPRCRSSRRPAAPAAARRSAGGGEQIAHRRPEGELVHARGAHRAGDRHQRRAGIGDRAELAIPARAEAGDQRELGQRLGVLDQRRAARGSRARTAAAERTSGFGHPAVQVVDDRALLAGRRSPRGRPPPRSGPDRARARTTAPSSAAHHRRAASGRP